MKNFESFVSIIPYIVVFCISIFVEYEMIHINRKRSSREYQLNYKKFTDKGKLVFGIIMTTVSSIISAVLYFVDFSKFKFINKATINIIGIIANVFIVLSSLMIALLTVKLMDIMINNRKYDFDGDLTYRLADIKTSKEETEN